MVARYFGTDGIRDVANHGPLRPEEVVKVGRALWVAIREAGRGAEGRCRVAIGRDTRQSGPMIASALSAGLTSTGCDVFDLGIIPTPGLALLIPSLECDLGVMVSASHNPMADNGIKVLGANGGKLENELEARIEEAMGSSRLPRPDGADVGTFVTVTNARESYVEVVESAFRARKVSLKGIRIALDCAHGAAYRSAPEILRRLGADVQVLADAPDGTNINADCGSLHPETLASYVTEHECHVGIALDGDADRAILVDEKGRVIDGDQLIAMLALDKKSRDVLPGSRVVATVMSNLGLEVLLRENGISLERTPVGDRYVSEALKRGGYSLGGEQSGHVIMPFGERLIGDGTITALEATALVAGGARLSELADRMTRYPQVILNVRVREKTPLEELPSVQKVTDTCRHRMGDDGRILLRYSGTEPLLRVMVEGIDDDLVQRTAQELADAVRGVLGT